MSNNLVFVEHKDEICLLEECIDKDAVIISITPSSGAELTRKKMDFHNTISLFGVEGHKEVASYSKNIIEALRPFLKEMNFLGIQESFEKTWIFYFRFLLHYWLTMFIIIDKAVKTYNPDYLIVVQSDIDSKKMSVSKIVKHYAVEHGINIKLIGNNKVYKDSKKIQKFIKNILIRPIFEFQLFIFRGISRGRSVQLLPSDSNNMPRFIGEISKCTKDAFPVYLLMHGSTFKVRIKEMLTMKTFSFFRIPKNVPNHKIAIFNSKYDDCTHQIKIWLGNCQNNLIINDAKFNTTMLHFINNQLKKIILDLYGETIFLNRVLECVNPKRVFAQHSLGINYALGEICFQKKIPAMLISHGSHVLHENLLAKYEWSIHAHTIFNSKYPFVALQTPWAKDFFKDQNDALSQGIETGPLLLSRGNYSNNYKSKIRKKIFGKHESKRILIHASTPKTWHSFRPWVYETVDEYVRNINDIIKAVDVIPDLYLAIRFRPLEGLTLSDFSVLLVKSDSYDIYSEGVFEEYLLASDLLLSYSSTTIEEALQNRVPILQYDPDDKYEHIPGQVLSADVGSNHVAAIYSVHSESDLMSALYWWSNNHPRDSDNKLFSWPEYVLKGVDKVELVKTMDKFIC
jgi:hypothetical protein